MTLKQLTNIQHPELVERIEQFVDMNASLPGVFRYVLTKYNNKWSLLMGVLIFAEPESNRTYEVCSYKYPNFQFICKSLKNVKLSELTLGLGNEDCLSMLDLPKLESKEDNLNWTESLIPSHASNGSFPIRRFSACLSANVHCEESKLIAHGMPFHLSAFEYVRNFLGLDKFHGSRDGRNGELCIDIPDQRGYLALSDKEIDYYCQATDKLSVVGEINGKPFNLSNPHNPYSFESEKASNIELWLVTDGNEVVDYRSSSEWEYRYGDQTSKNDLKKLLQIIASGESEHCEFKQYIDLVGKKNSKAKELEKTVCALSNHQGGTLFIGVDDDTRILGINDGCQRDYKCNSPECVGDYQKAVVKRLQESLNKNQCFKVYPIEHKGIFVLVVDIDKANGLNYLLSKKEAYIRRGASSPQMTPSEIQLFPVEQDFFGRELSHV